MTSGKLKILLIEDDEDDYLIIKNMFDLIIMDYILPDTDGVALIKGFA